MNTAALVRASIAADTIGSKHYSNELSKERWQGAIWLRKKWVTACLARNLTSKRGALCVYTGMTSLKTCCVGVAMLGSIFPFHAL